jgi:hypothetical protein
MWSANYTNVDKSGLQPELRVFVQFSNDVDDTTYQREYTVMPADFPDGLTTPIQFQVDILNSKDVITEDSIATVIATPVSLKPIMTPPIVEQPIV